MNSGKQKERDLRESLNRGFDILAAGVARTLKKIISNNRKFIMRPYGYKKEYDLWELWKMIKKEKKTTIRLLLDR